MHITQQAALGAMLLVAACAPAAAQLSTLSPSVMRTGFLSNEAECGATPQAVWVSAPHSNGAVEGECIRYYAAGFDTDAAAKHPHAVVYLHGQRLTREFDAAGRTVRSLPNAEYRNPTTESMLAAARAGALALGHPFIFMARPGTYGSSGDHKESYRLREVLLVNAALDAIKARHRIAGWAVASQSGGGLVHAGLLARRSDIRCAVFSSSLVAMTMKEELLKQPRVVDREAGAYDPMEHVASIAPDAQRRILMIGDDADQSVPRASQRAWAQALRGRGIGVTEFDGVGVGASRHGLGGSAQRMAAWCIEGADDAAIERRLAPGEVALRYDGGSF